MGLMARKPINLGAGLLIVGAIGLIGLSQQKPGAFWLIVAIGVCWGAIFLLMRAHDRESMRKKAHMAIRAHISALARKRAQKFRMDDYGNAIPDKWNAEIIYFLKNVVAPKLSEGEQKALARDIGSISELVEKLASEEQMLREESSDYSENLSPTDFEVHCANVLRKHGWIARLTGASGDQGVDVIAERENIRVVVQCKKYSGPVGNKAVQEVFAAKKHEAADHAAVVTNASFTKSAKQLAATTGVLLLHANDLSDLWALVEEAGS
jgi:restriction system protein